MSVQIFSMVTIPLIRHYRNHGNSCLAGNSRRYYSLNLWMAKVQAPFIVARTIEDLTFYMMHKVNYVRKKSSLTRKRVLKSPEFAKTRRYAGLMSQASRVGSVVFQALPISWRQAWMYRSFTGEAIQLLNQGTTVEDTTRVLWETYVEPLAHRVENASGRLQDALDRAAQPPRGRRKKMEPAEERLKQYSDLLSEASKMASSIYDSLPSEEKKSVIYRACVGEAMRFLQEEKRASGDEIATISCSLSESREMTGTSFNSETALEQKCDEVRPTALVPEVGNRKFRHSSDSLTKRLFYIPPVEDQSAKYSPTWRNSKLKHKRRVNNKRSCDRHALFKE